MARYLRQLVFVVILSMVLYAIFRATPPTMVFNHSDKVGHLLAFIALALSGRFVVTAKLAGLFWCVMLLMSFILEYLQGEIRPLRVFSVADAVANGVGVLLAAALYYIYQKLKRF